MKEMIDKSMLALDRLIIGSVDSRIIASHIRYFSINRVYHTIIF